MTVQQTSEEHVRGPGWLGRARRGGPAAVVVRLSSGEEAPRDLAPEVGSSSGGALLAAAVVPVVLFTRSLRASGRDR